MGKEEGLIGCVEARGPLWEAVNLQPVCTNGKTFFQRIHGRFIRDEIVRKNMIDNGRTEEICRLMDDLSDEDHTHH